MRRSEFEPQRHSGYMDAELQHQLHERGSKPVSIGFDDAVLAEVCGTGRIPLGEALQKIGFAALVTFALALTLIQLVAGSGVRAEAAPDTTNRNEAARLPASRELVR